MPSLQYFGLAAASLVTLASTASAGWSWNNLPYQSEASANQQGYNNCTGQNSQTSKCQTSVINSIEDFCLWGPPDPNSEIGVTEQIEVAYCTREGRGTRSIPSGVLQGVHFRQTPDFVQITGWGDFTKMNVKAGDAGGELDPHGPDGYGNPHGGLVFSDAFGGGMKQIEEWSNFMSATQFCFRACNPNDTGKAKKFCPHVYDVMGCDWNMPADYSVGAFDTCRADSGEPAGTYGTSTFWQGQPNTPPAHPVPASSSCTKITDLSLGQPAPSVTGVTAVTSVAAATTTSKSASGSITTAKPVSVTSGINGGAAAGTVAPMTSTKPNGGFSMKVSTAGMLMAAIGVVMLA